MKKVTIHSDGGCEGNPGPGAWAAVLRYGVNTKEVSGGTAATTNNRMELQAAIEALRALKEACEGMKLHRTPESEPWRIELELRRKARQQRASSIYFQSNQDAPRDDPADWSGEDFSDADLRGANLSGCAFQNANFKDAKLYDA